MNIDVIKAAIRSPYYTVFLDGRNEHGSHVLPMPGDSIARGHKQIEADLENQETGLGETIIKDAEKFGFEISHCVVTLWKHCEGDYWEYERISPTLTELMIGTAADQKSAFNAAETATA